MTMGQGITVASVNLPVFRMLLAVGLLRVLVRREFPVGGINAIDSLVIAWGGWTFFASFFHDGSLGSGPIFITGIIANKVLFYFLLRIFCCDQESTMNVIKVIAILLAPVAAEMMFERVTGRNLFAVFGGVSEHVMIRNGTLRAQGPFRHPILAGTVGAACLPLMFGIFSRYRNYGIIGIVACLGMTLACASSGPIMSVFFGVVAMLIWRIRRHVATLQWGLVGAYVLLDLMMTRPAYYAISKIDLSGGSTGWHRARLIESTIAHVSEWWLFGTDYTRHWMATGVSWSTAHTDITNYYVQFAVWGGMLSVLLIVILLWKTFQRVGELVRVASLYRDNFGLFYWSLGAGMFAQVASGISVSYFDQSVAFFWGNVAIISSFHSSVVSVGAQTPDVHTPSDSTSGQQASPPAQTILA